MKHYIDEMIIFQYETEEIDTACVGMSQSKK